ncbi:MAG: LamG domain-containing protein [Deltaproteobacteria bacterium]|nr:LamG domain-containing protein [Deltaproteobacteria bacterium]
MRCVGAVVLTCAASLVASCGGGDTSGGGAGGGTGGSAVGGGGGSGGASSGSGGEGQPPCHNYALRFDGIDDVVDVADHPALDGLTAFTVEVRIRPGPGIGDREMEIFSHHLHPTHGYALIFQSYTPLMGRMFYESTLLEVSGGAEPDDTSKEFTEGVWTNVALTFDGTTTALFVDGARVASRDANIKQPSDVDAVLRIGGSAKSGQFAFAGAMDVMRLSKVARYTDSGPTPAHEWQADDDTIALWRFDEAWGFEAIDETGEHHGVLDGFEGPSNGPQYERILCEGVIP